MKAIRVKKKAKILMINIQNFLFNVHFILKKEKKLIVSFGLQCFKLLLDDYYSSIYSETVTIYYGKIYTQIMAIKWFQL